MLVATLAWKAAFPGAVAAVLIMRDVRNPSESPALESRKRALEHELRTTPPDEHVLAAYAKHYGPHGKTFHVRAQRESVAEKGGSIPTRAALVEVMFMAELRNLLLTAAHDRDALEPPLRVDATRGGETYELMNGKSRRLLPGDMAMADRQGIVSSVLHGPDRRTRITPETTSVLFAVYAPAGIGEAPVRAHLQHLHELVRLVAPNAREELRALVA